MFGDLDVWEFVPLVGVIAWAVVAVVWALTGRSRRGDTAQLRAALDANAAANRQVAERLDAIDRRLAAVEKTLTDIG
jgi:hypothetical protein